MMTTSLLMRMSQPHMPPLIQPLASSMEWSLPMKAPHQPQAPCHFQLLESTLQNYVWGVVQVLPLSWLVDVCVENTSHSLMMTGYPPWWIDSLLWYFVPDNDSLEFSYREFLISHEYHETESLCPDYLSTIMTLKRFELVLEYLHCWAPNHPSYCDTFWEARDMLSAWKKNYWSFSVLPGLPVWVNQVHLEFQVDLSYLGIPSRQVTSFWEWMPHHLL